MNLKAKLTSRKFWITLISTAAGIAGLLGADGNLVAVITGALTALVPAVVYVITEGKIDAAGVRQVASAIADSAEIIAGTEPKTDTVTKTDK